MNGSREQGSELSFTLFQETAPSTSCFHWAEYSERSFM